MGSGDAAPEPFGAILRRRRLAAGLTQEGLAERAGLSVRGVSDLERGARRAPQRETVRRLIRALGLRPAGAAALEADAVAARRGVRAGWPPEPRSGLTDAPLTRASRNGARDNLPLQLTSFVGRERELAEVAGLLGTARLLTLTGSPGVGKTRLALRAAAARERSPGARGAYFVALAPLREPELLVPTIAQAVGVREGGARPPMESLQDVLRPGQALLLLDNFEHLVEQGAVVHELLAGCPGLTVLVTSRAALRLSGEHEFLVSPLPYPQPGSAVENGDLGRFDAVALFVDRARAVRPDFALDAQNGPAVAEICRRLEGLPLAVEMAAARTKVLPPRVLAPRLGNRLDLLGLQAQGRSAQHQTLRAALDWSYSLLPPEGQRLLRRLAVFAGGCTLEAAEAVCLPADDAGDARLPDVLSGIAALVDQSLLLLDESSDGRPRFRMLQPVREFVLEQLEASSEAEAIWGRYGAFVAGLADAAAEALNGPEQAASLRRLDAELGNLRGALTWARSSGDVGLQLRLAGALWEYWWVRGTISEALWWLERALEAGGAPGSARARALHGAGTAATLWGEFETAERYFVESVELWRALGDPAGLARALSYQAALPWMRGDDGGAKALLREALSLWQRLRHGWGSGYALHAASLVAFTSGDTAGAVALMEDALHHFHGVPDGRGIAFASVNLSIIRLSCGEVGPAERLARESLALFRELHDALGYVEALVSLAGSAAAQGRTDRAAQLVGAADAVRESTGMAPLRGLQQVRDAAAAGARAALGESAFAAAYKTGQAMPLEHALEFALTPQEAPPAAPVDPAR